MPDRPQGYVKSKRILEPSIEVAQAYRQRQKEETARFDEMTQQLIIQELQVASEYRRFRLHGIATDPTHLHALLSWIDDRSYEEVRRGTRESITRKLNQHLKRQWLSHRGSRKRVRGRKHFNYLMEKYLPSHRGHCWFEGQAAG